MNTEFNLVLTTESKVVATNFKDFEKQADAYLKTLTEKFETDDDFARAKEEVKELEAVEKRIRAVIDGVKNGSKEVSELLDSAAEWAETFRQERLKRKKLVESKEAEIKQRIVNGALDEISEIRGKYESSVSLALEQTMPKSAITNRLEEATKNKRKLDGLVKSVNAEKTLILAELAQESARITARLKMIPVAYEHLFRDALQLVAGTDDLEPIIAERVNAEQQREAELKAKAEEDAKAKAESQAIASETETQSAVEKTQENSTALSDEPTFNFEIRIAFTGTQEQAIALARNIKAQYGDNVSLKKMN
ncbi:hypothetical protein [Aggregatibacter sp. Marseille-P9115]|jgi:hypothetical protein|uniref:hypothetical protein n=1 Tax=Aggregatibacter sp. Marseille-P9115 TaxID=2866570 RepID=UPI001E34DE3B|nr:hypothetical protein [Aggregatibacter sp. Marseille-P9115]